MTVFPDVKLFYFVSYCTLCLLILERSLLDELMKEDPTALLACHFFLSKTMGRTYSSSAAQRHNKTIITRLGVL